MATLEGKKIVVIGGTSGIGYAVAKGALLSRAAHVLVASSNPARVAAAVARLAAEPALQTETAHVDVPARVAGGVVDMNDAAGVRAFLATAGAVDHLVVTSGRFTGAVDFRTADLEQSRAHFSDRFFGAATAAQSVQLRAGGSITFTIGTLLHRPMLTRAMLTSGAGAVDALTRALAVELAPLRVNVVAPGAVDTELWDMFPPAVKQKMLAEHEAKLPTRHVAGPDEVAEAYLFLMKCNYITGQRIDVEGGVIAKIQNTENAM